MNPSPTTRRSWRERLQRPSLAFVLLLSSAPVLAGGSIVAKHAALSTGSPAATRAGLAVLQRGGNAADAAVAVAFTLAVVYPQGGNLGGGGMLVYYDAASRGVWALDFRETSPKSATRDLFAGDPNTARNGATAGGVPGTVAGLDALHRRFGSRPWSELLAPAAALAREGLAADAELTSDLAAARRDRAIERFASTEALFFSEGKPRDRIVLADLARTIERLSQKGARDFYEGDTARALVEAVRTAGGLIGHRDLAEYRPAWRAPIRLRYGPWDIHTVPPPSGGAIILGEALNILSGDDLAAMGFQSTAAIHLLLEAQRRASIDRNHYVADPLTTRIPYRELLSARRAAQWRKSIDLTRVVATANLAEPVSAEVEGEHTTHFTIADGEGNVVSLTTTLGENFGSGWIVPGLGFFLNNAMDDFTTAPSRPNHDGLVQGSPNQIDPGKRPASSLTPTIVLRDGRPFLALGTSGGAAIPSTILQVFLDVAVWGRSLQDAVDAPRWHHQGIPEEAAYESGRAPRTTVDALNAMGHGVSGRAAIGDVHAIQFEKDRLVAVADPRRGGAAGGY